MNRTAVAGKKSTHLGRGQGKKGQARTGKITSSIKISNSRMIVYTSVFCFPLTDTFPVPRFHFSAIRFLF